MEEQAQSQHTIPGNTIIESLGVYLPPREVSSSEILQACRQKILYPLERLTGIQFRHMAGDIEFAIDLAKEATKRCLARSKYQPHEIDLVISCNISRYDGPNFQFTFEPSTSVRLRAELGLTSALCFDISNACAGMFTGVHIADAFLKAGFVKNALIVSGEYITHLTRTAQLEIRDERDQRMACLTLGDAGAAAILELTPNSQYGFHDIEMYTLGAYSDCCIAKPTNSKAGGAIMLTDSIRIHSVAIRESVRHVIKKLREINWSPKNLKHFVMHQTARSAISELARQINDYYREQALTQSNMIYNVERRGNTSSTTHFVAIWDNILNGRIQPGDNIVFAVQASGITLGTAPYTFDDLPDRLRRFEKEGKAYLDIPRRPTQSPFLRVQKKSQPPEVRIINLSILSSEKKQSLPHSAIRYAIEATQSCLQHAPCEKEKISLLIYSGVHRDEFLSEPAIASILSGELKINDTVVPESPYKTFAYDVLNGSTGFLNSCHNAIAMIQSKKAHYALIVNAEMENNADLRGRPLLGIHETASALLLGKTEKDEEGGFLILDFFYFPQYKDAFYSHVGQEEGKSYLDFRKDPNMEQYYRESILTAIHQFMQKYQLQWSEIDCFLPPQISSSFVDQIRVDLGLSPEQVMNCGISQDLYTSSIPFALKQIHQMQKWRRGGLILAVTAGTGIQIGCMLYQMGDPICLA